MILSMRDCVHAKIVEYVLIHDGARPFITEEIIERGSREGERNRSMRSGNAVQRYR